MREHLRWLVFPLWAEVDHCLSEDALQGVRWSRVLLRLHTSVKEEGRQYSQLPPEPFLDNEWADVCRGANKRDPGTSASVGGGSPF